MVNLSYQRYRHQIDVNLLDLKTANLLNNFILIYYLIFVIRDLYKATFAGVAQMAEQGFCKPQVVGSIPTASTTALINSR